MRKTTRKMRSRDSFSSQRGCSSHNWFITKNIKNIQAFHYLAIFRWKWPRLLVTKRTKYFYFYDLYIGKFLKEEWDTFYLQIQHCFFAEHLFHIKLSNNQTKEALPDDKKWLPLIKKWRMNLTSFFENVGSILANANAKI